MPRKTNLESGPAMEIAGLSALELAELRRLWTLLLGSEPLARISRDLLVRAIAYRLQEKRHGGLSSKELRLLDRLASGLGSKAETSCVKPRVSARVGTCFVREWQGAIHEVVVIEDGYSWKGRTYRSLSETARAITGARCSGPRFFGLIEDGKAARGQLVLERDVAMLPSRPLCCAVYTRKSSEEGLEQSFNSLHAQREACEAYINSQRHEGWSIIPAAYDDGGFSGGTMERPGLKALLDDVREGRVNVVVVYKIDRLTRSLFDFAKIVEVLDAAGASFVSVTQSFNTTTSMGRLTLNVLLSFAQFEREVTGERIRDKIAASRRKGMWMGGNVPFGYDLQNHRLISNSQEAKTVRLIFECYLRLGTVRLLKQRLDGENVRTKQRLSRKTDGSEIQAGGLPFGVGPPLHRLAQPDLHRTGPAQGERLPR